MLQILQIFSYRTQIIHIIQVIPDSSFSVCHDPVLLTTGHTGGGGKRIDLNHLATKIVIKIKYIQKQSRS